ncbi:uncharacterized protein G2W53_033933 [Senna tora]|uniref:Uncharacterized protein n=1 Tax=Senna tora TaxID=362788 RepID=A0A834T355_9FABA|nr:uncharacterized protein G2W53_033933 [Senna tora]
MCLIRRAFDSFFYREFDENQWEEITQDLAMSFQWCSPSQLTSPPPHSSVAFSIRTVRSAALFRAVLCLCCAVRAGRSVHPQLLAIIHAPWPFCYVAGLFILHRCLPLVHLSFDPPPFFLLLQISTSLTLRGTASLVVRLFHRTASAVVRLEQCGAVNPLVQLVRGTTSLVVRLVRGIASAVVQLVRGTLLEGTIFSSSWKNFSLFSVCSSLNSPPLGSTSLHFLLENFISWLTTPFSSCCFLLSRFWALLLASFWSTEVDAPWWAAGRHLMSPLQRGSVSGVHEKAKVAVIDVMMDALGADRVYSVIGRRIVSRGYCDGTVTILVILGRH